MEWYFYCELGGFDSGVAKGSSILGLVNSYQHFEDAAFLLNIGNCLPVDSS